MVDLNDELDMQVARALGWTELQTTRVFSRDNVWFGRRPDGSWDVVEAFSTLYDPEQFILALQARHGGLVLVQYNPHYKWYVKWWKGDAHDDAGGASLRGALCALVLQLASVQLPASVQQRVGEEP